MNRCGRPLSAPPRPGTCSTRGRVGTARGVNPPPLPPPACNLRRSKHSPASPHSWHCARATQRSHRYRRREPINTVTQVTLSGNARHSYVTRAERASGGEPPRCLHGVSRAQNYPSRRRWAPHVVTIVPLHARGCSHTVQRLSHFAVSNAQCASAHHTP